MKIITDKIAGEARVLAVDEKTGRIFFRNGEEWIPVGGKDFPDPSPAVEQPVIDPDFGRCNYLDADYRYLTFADPVWQLKKVRMLIRSISEATGNIVLVPVVDGVERSTSIIVPVGAAWAVVDIPLEVETGEIALLRDTEDERDTLKTESGSVTAVLRCIRLEVGNE